MKRSVLLSILIITNVMFLFGQENAIHLNPGSSDYVNCGNAADINITGNQITLEAWVYISAFRANVWEGVVMAKVGPSDRGYMIRIGGVGTVNFNLGNGGWNEINSPANAVALNTWHHIAGTYDGTNMRLYVDGVEVASGGLTGAIGASSANLYLGEDPTWTGRFFNGRVEEVKIWNVNRTQAQVQGDMSTYPCLPFDAGMVRYFRFNQYTANVANAGNIAVYDEITSSFNATLTNSTLNGTASNWVVGRPLDPVPDATFTMSEINCSSAEPIVTGTPGGSYSFNLAPGDAAVIDPVTGILTNGTAGSTYFILYDAGCGQTSVANITLPAIGNSNFTLTEFCGGATASITGHLGGIFSWNPDLGDGAQLNASTGLITDAVAGTTYNVRYTVCGGSTTVGVLVNEANCWTLNGDATNIIVGSEQCIQLTDAVNDETGCAWNSNSISFSSDFTLTLDYYFGSSINGADGNTFTFQPSNSVACGGSGGQLGAGGISNALSIEFDTYDNDNPAHVYDMTPDHISIEIDGDHQNAAPLCGPVAAKADLSSIDDGGTYEVSIEWISATNTLNVYFDGDLRLTCVNDFVTNAFGGVSDVYWGATSATGGLNNQQYFCPSTILVLPVELLSFDTECTNDGARINFTSGEESLFNRFEIQRTYDGMMFETIESIEAKGSFSEYEYIDNTKSQTTYYRLKMIDLNGDFEYTEIISSDCINNKPADFSVLYGDDQIFLNLEMPYNMNAEVMIMNTSGQLIQNSFITGTGKVKLDLDPMSKGVYFVRVKSVNASFDLTKKMVKF